MVGDTAFYAFRERSEQEIFRNIFCFLIVTGLWVKPFLILAEFFQSVVNIAFYVPRGRFGGKIDFFQNNYDTFLSETGQKTLSFFNQIFPGSFLKKCLVPFQTNIFKEFFFSENFHFGFLFRFWAANIRQACQKIVYFARRTTEESGFYFKWFDSWYRFLTVNKFFRIPPDNFQQVCQYCNLRVEMNNLRRKIFFSNKLSISIFLGVWGLRVWIFSTENNQDLQNCI